MITVLSINFNKQKEKEREREKKKQVRIPNKQKRKKKKKKGKTLPSFSYIQIFGFIIFLNCGSREEGSNKRIFETPLDQ